LFGEETAKVSTVEWIDMQKIIIKYTVCIFTAESVDNSRRKNFLNVSIVADSTTVTENMFH
jgi:hypothetical protein